MHPGDIEKTAFTTFLAHFEYLVIPFRFACAPGTFQVVMNFLCGPDLRIFILVFFDDILIYNKTMQEHLEHLKFTQVEYLGHVVSGHGVSTDPQKIQAMNDWHVPTSV